MSTELSPENERFIEEELAHGSFKSRLEALDAGVELLRLRRTLLARILEGRRQLDDGEFAEFDDETLRERFDQLKDRCAQPGNDG